MNILIKNLIGRRRNPSESSLILIAAAIAWCAILPTTYAVSPPPDGGYPGGNTAEGDGALLHLAAPNSAYNTAVGYFALRGLEAGNFNTAVGAGALFLRGEGEQNTAIGAVALFNTSGAGNTATGVGALFSNISGNSNTAIGLNALNNNSTGSLNIALGDYAGTNLTTGSENIYIGNTGLAGDLGTIRIGEEFEVGGQHSCYIAGISGKTVAGGAAVFVNSDGKLGTNTSSERFKDHIQSMGEASEAILALRPVSFRYKKEIDPHRIPQFGLIAEEVERVNPDLIIRDKEGKPLTVRYEQINAMLLNEFLKEHKKVEEQQATIAELKSAVAKHEAAGSKQEAAIALQQKQIQTLTASLNKQAAQIQKVSARVELNRPAPQELVLNLP